MFARFRCAAKGGHEQLVSVWVQDLLWGLPAAVFFNWTAGSTCSRLGRSQ